MSIVRSESQEYQTQLIIALKGSWVIVETSGSYVMGRVMNVDLRNLNLLLSPAIILVSNSRIAFRAVLIRGSDVKKIMACEDENQCNDKLDHIRKLLMIQ